MTGIAMGSQALGLLAIGVLARNGREGISQGGCCAIFTVIVTFGAFSYPGFQLGYLDMSPRHYGTAIISVGNSIAALPGIFGNLSVEWFDSDFSSVFLCACVISLVGMLPYVLFGDARDQKFERYAGAAAGVL